MRTLIIIVFTIFIVQFAIAQQTSPATQGQAEKNVIDLTKLGKTYTISARMELPQVRIFNKRITPNFKEVNAEKSFANELSVDAEQIKFEPITSGRVKPIPNIEKLLKKKRF
ncbi:hypothetical protein B1H10_04575 [candidate division KSB1 bacterium 4484_188]|nr:MAG: hypothetical protein B1H10_04575 [candidate division KSB1 bacterium 4484_188]HFE63442.1 hypothetical protein [Caldithrix sp.]